MTEFIPQIAIVTDDPGWHGQQLVDALRHHGLGASYVKLTDSYFSFSDEQIQLKLSGFENRYPLGVFVRGVPGGTLEQVILRLDYLHALTRIGIVVYNDPRAIERTVDKTMTTFLLNQAGLPTPPTWVFESEQAAHALCDEKIAQGKALVLKPPFGSQGIGVQLVDRDHPLSTDETFSGVYYLQQFVERSGTEWKDIRVFVINNCAVAAMMRVSSTWITNRARGARCERLIMDNNLKELAEAAARAVSIDYAGVDIIIDPDGKLQIIEINSVPAWWGLQSVTDLNIAGAIIDDFVKKIGESHALTVQS